MGVRSALAEPSTPPAGSDGRDRSVTSQRRSVTEALVDLWRGRLGRWVPYLLLAGVALWLWWPRASGPDTGVLAPDFDLPLVTADGARFRLAEHRGEPVLIEVFASWCQACRGSAPTLVEVAGARRARPVQVLAISVDDEAEVAAATARAWGLNVPVAHADAAFSREYGVTVLPTYTLIGPDGTVLESASGPLGASRLERWLSDVGAARQ